MDAIFYKNIGIEWELFLCRMKRIYNWCEIYWKIKKRFGIIKTGILQGYIFLDLRFEKYVILYDSKTAMPDIIKNVPFEKYVILYDSKTLTSSFSSFSSFEKYVILYDSKTYKTLNYTTFRFEKYVILYDSKT